MDVRVGLERKVRAEELMLLNCGVGEDSWESLYSKEIQSVHYKGKEFWIFIRRTDAEAGTLALWQPDVNNWFIGKTLMLGKIEGGRRRGWQRMRWLDVITNSMGMSLSKLREWWWTGKPGVLQSMGSQRVRHDWATKLNWTELNLFLNI